MYGEPWQCAGSVQYMQMNETDNVRIRWNKRNRMQGKRNRKRNRIHENRNIEITPEKKISNDA